MLTLALLLPACTPAWDTLPDDPAALCAGLNARSEPDRCALTVNDRDWTPDCLEVICDPTLGRGPEAPACEENAVVTIATLDEARAQCEAQGGVWSWQIPTADTRCPHSAPDVTPDAFEQARLFPRPIHVACGRAGG